MKDMMKYRTSSFRSYMRKNKRMILKKKLLVILAILYAGCASPTEPPLLVKQGGDFESLAEHVFIPLDIPLPMGQNGKGDWTLIFNDEFDGPALDKDKWTTCYWWDWANLGCTNAGNRELEWYQPDDVLVVNGALHLRAQQRTIQGNDGNTYQYTSGMISSGRSRVDPAPPGLVFQYGYAEIRAKLPSGKGLWPTFWMLPQNNQNDRSKPEIDIMEILGHAPDVIHMTLHYQTPEGADSDGVVWVGPDFSKDWHVFALDWRPGALIWYVDGVEQRRYTDLTYIPNEPMYLLLNLAVGGEWPGEPDSSTVFPSYFEVDYVRVWKH